MVLILNRKRSNRREVVRTILMIASACLPILGQRLCLDHLTLTKHILAVYIFRRLWSMFFVFGAAATVFWRRPYLYRLIYVRLHLNMLRRFNYITETTVLLGLIKVTIVGAVGIVISICANISGSPLTIDFSFIDFSFIDLSCNHLSWSSRTEGL